MDLVPYIAPAASNALSTLVRTVSQHPEATAQISSAAARAAVKKISTAYKKYKRGKRPTKRRKRSKLDSVPNSTTFQHQAPIGSNNLFDNLFRKTLFAKPLRLILPASNNVTYGAAPAHIYHLNGFKFCGIFHNRSAAPISVRIRFVQPVRENITLSDIPTNFFIDNASSSQKYGDFTSWLSNTAWDPVQDCNKINPRKFNILHTMDFQLNGKPPASFPSGDPGPVEQHTGKSWKRIDKYIKANANFEFEDSVASDPLKPIWMVMYWESLFPTTDSGGLDGGGLDYYANTTGYVKNKAP